MNNKKEYSNQQHCPSCNRYVKYSTRYPNYACAKCVIKAIDEKGRAIRFSNLTADGHGCQGILTESNKIARSKVCFIKGIRFKAEESYFGGIVLLPSVKCKRTRKKGLDLLEFDE